MNAEITFEPQHSSKYLFSDCPAHWEIKRLKWSLTGLFNGIWGNEPNGEDGIVCVRVADFNRLKNSVVDHPPTLRAVEPKFLENRQLETGDLLIEKSGGGDKQLVGCVVSFEHDFDAVCSNFVARMQIAGGMYSRFWVYVHAALYTARLNFSAIKQTTGIQNLDAEIYLDIKVAFPPLAEQQSIADYLDRETARIDSLIAEKEQMLALLEEKRAALISQAVTRGLNPDVVFEPSRLDWLGEIPQHWKVDRAKNLFSVRDERSETGSEELLSVSHITGVTARSEKEVYMFQADDKAGYKLCYPNDLVINTLWGWMGALGVSPLAGIVSPDYHVYKIKNLYLPEFIELLCRSKPFIAEVNRWSKGVWSSRLRLYPENFFEIRLPIPPLDEQQNIVDRIKVEQDRHNELNATAQRSIELLKERRAALITAAVTGQIDLEEMAA